MEVYSMNDFQNDLQHLSASQFQAGEMTPWNQQSQNPAGQFPGMNPADQSRLCVGIGFCVGFCGGFEGGFCGGFCGGFEGGFCGGFCGGFHRCGGFCGGFHQCGGFCHQRCR
jgi:heterocycloanthracin/sonorensin family bacteriocin